MGVPRVLVIPGDGIGSEVVNAALYVLEKTMEVHEVDLEIRYAEAGDLAAREHGEPLPKETLRLAKNWADAVLKGPIGETARDVVIVLRRELGVYANIRPARSFPGVTGIAPIDMVIVRENLEDVYAGIEFSVPGAAFAVKVVTEEGTRRVAHVALRYASTRTGRVTIVHKANVLRVADGLFRDVARHVLEEAGIVVDEMYVDAAAMELVRNPSRFDVVLTMNQYGDILSDLAAQVAGGLGLAPSANIGDGKALFEPVHGAAWDIAGKGVANPTAMILSVTMMLEYLGYHEAASRIELAVERALAAGFKTRDLGGWLSTMDYAKAVARFIR